MSSEQAPGLTIVALARNETHHLRPCFDRLQPLIDLTGAETLILFDSRGDKATLEAAHEVADRVIVADFEGFARQRNRALDQARSRWVFFIDPDERCTPSLAREIAHTVARGTCAAYSVPRRNFFFGHEVRYTGWSPDYQMRLLERERCRYDETRLVHEVPTVSGEAGTLHNRLVHYNYATWGRFIAKQRAYSDLEAESLYISGRRARLRNLLGQPLRELKRRLIDYRGYRDGALGVALSLAMSLYVVRTYLKLWQLQRRASRHAGAANR